MNGSSNIKTNLTVDDWAQVKEIFDELSGLTESEAQSGLTQRCSKTPHILSVVEQMLSVFYKSANATITPNESAACVIARHAMLRKGEVFGKYKIEKTIGSGGMGQVYLAHRNDEVHQLVAIKILGQHVMDVQSEARFDVERRVLASLEHPNIARLIDAGSQDGCDYYVMEYVNGIPVDEYCIKKRLGLKSRLELFLKICKAVSVAHKHLVVHRDLKPNNILVTDSCEVKLLDFGIAKSLKPIPGIELIHETVVGSAALTPQYAAPEQVNGGDINVACDIYVLGLLLHLLLTDQHAFDLSDMTWGQIENAINNEISKLPSKVTNGKQLKGVKFSASVWAQKLKGDLDSIVGHALKKEPEQRYESVDEMASDIKHYLNYEPIKIKNNHTLYRVKKNLRKHWVPISALTVIFVVLLSSILLVWQKSITAEQQRDKALTEKQVSEEVTGFLIETFKSADPTKVMGNKLTAGHILNQGVTKLDGLNTSQPVKDRLLTTLAEVYVNLSEYNQAELLINKVSSDVFGSKQGRINTAFIKATIEAEKGKINDALLIISKIESELQIRTALYFKVMSFKCKLLKSMDDENTAIVLAQLLMDKSDEWFGTESYQYAIQLRVFGKAIKNNENRMEVIGIYKQSIDILNELRNVNVKNEQFKTMRFLLTELINTEQYDAALDLSQQLEGEYKQVFPDEHTVYGHLYTAMGNVYLDTNKANLSIAYQKKSREIYKNAIGEDSTRVAFNEINIGAAYLYLLSDFKEAKTHYETALNKFKKNNGKTNNYYYMLLPYATCLIKLNQYDEAKLLVSESLIYHLERKSPSLRNSSLAKSLLAHILIHDGELIEGHKLLLESKDVVQQNYANTIHSEMIESDMKIFIN